MVVRTIKEELVKEWEFAEIPYWCWTRTIKCTQLGVGVLHAGEAVDGMGTVECTAMEMRLNADVVQKYGINLNRAVATGGGSNNRF